jgi:hypothetical protein
VHPALSAAATAAARLECFELFRRQHPFDVRAKFLVQRLDLLLLRVGQIQTAQAQASRARRSAAAYARSLPELLAARTQLTPLALHALFEAWTLRITGSPLAPLRIKGDGGSTDPDGGDCECDDEVFHLHMASCSDQ